jgi:hypothetical protein
MSLALFPPHCALIFAQSMATGHLATFFGGICGLPNLIIERTQIFI